MFDKHQKLDVTQDELTVIEAALHTQVKILGVQAAAGGSGAQRRLNEVKRTLVRVSQERQSQDRSAFRAFFCWFRPTRCSA